MVKGVKNKDMILVVAVTLILVLAIIQVIYNSDNVGGLGVSKRYCIDSDGGLHPGVAGELSLLKTTDQVKFVDLCLSEMDLKEYYCGKNVPVSQVVTCETGCSDGACI